VFTYFYYQHIYKLKRPKMYLERRRAPHALGFRVDELDAARHGGGGGTRPKSQARVRARGHASFILDLLCAFVSPPVMSDLASLS
jgi:hypothetical protein